VNAPVRLRAGALLALLAAALSPTAASAAYQGANGAIAFVGDSAGQDGLFLRAHGQIHALLLADGLGDPVFSPYGPRIAVTREAPGVGRAVWIFDAHGRGGRQLTALSAAGAEPTWAPGGRALAYASGPIGGRTIHVVAADGSGDRPLTHGPLDQHAPAWERRGRIAYAQGNRLGEDIYTVRSDGSGRRHLTRMRGDETDPAWSPRGDRIAFVRTGRRRGIWVMSRWGRGKRRVTHVRGGAEQGVAFSPNGRRLLFAGGAPGRRRIYSVRLDGKRRRALSLPGSNGRDPDWRSVGHDPVIAAAGDIACDPATSVFRGGLGTPHFCGMARTAHLLMRPDLSRVLVLGDEQYPDGDLGRF
jgi:TolB protein